MNNQLVRCIHLSRYMWSASKSNLAKLRKKTGYTFANCKKALELNDNDLVKVKIVNNFFYQETHLRLSVNSIQEQ